MIAIRREDGFEFTTQEYRDLYERSAASLFQHPGWLEHLYGSLAAGVGAEPLVVTGRDPADGALRLVLPLVRVRDGFVRRVEFADLGVCDYAVPVVDPAIALEVLDAKVTTAIRGAVGPADLIRMDRVPGEVVDTALPLLEGSTAVAHHYGTHRLALPASTEAWRSTLDPSFERHLARKRKRLRPKGAFEFVQLTEPGEIDEALLTMQRFRQARFAERRGVDLVQDPYRFGFYRAVAHASARTGGPGRTTVLRVGGETVAVSFGLADADRHLFLLVGYDFDRLRNYSLGLLIVEELILDSIGRGRTEFDLTVGNEGYKVDFGAVSTPMRSVRLPITFRGRAAQAVDDGRLAARRAAKRALAYQQHRSPGLDPAKVLRGRR